MTNTIGITALIPPELIYACGHRPLDVNNVVPESSLSPRSKLCAWTALWRDLILSGSLDIDSLVVVAGGDCHNALVDGQKVSLSGLPTHYFFYPFDTNTQYLHSQLKSLEGFLGGIKDRKMFNYIYRLKKKGLALEKQRVNDNAHASDVFSALICFSDMQSDPYEFENLIDNIPDTDVEYSSRVAMIGVPPIYPDFHKVAEEFGLHIVYDELPYEFIRLGGNDLQGLAKSYKDYSFAGPIKSRIKIINHELQKRRVDGVIHYTQFACHHTLEDEIFRDYLDYPFLTVQGDLPGSTPEQLKLRLEAFSEMLEIIP
ncbi:MAG: 2-hydroxyacyl-CoA dehydratase family protein, partial [Euryarchaeota archaeon]|nr:2-hydroxyacyl-CoA dehydratase family protein [Euryarchaeota archaeon]